MVDAVKDLNDMIERIRAEADAAGYARAMAEVAAFVGRPSKPPKPAKPEAPKVTKASQGAAEKLQGPRRERGSGRRLVLKALAEAGGPLSIQTIKEIIALKEGETLAYSSVQNALEQLERDLEVKNVGRGVWEILLRPISDGEMI